MDYTFKFESHSQMRFLPNGASTLYSWLPHRRRFVPTLNNLSNQKLSALGSVLRIH